MSRGPSLNDQRRNFRHVDIGLLLQDLQELSHYMDAPLILFG